MRTSSLPVTRVTRDEQASLDRTGWPGRLPCVQQIFDRGLALGAVTVFVGENGSGKSTLVEAIAQAYGLSAEGGSVLARHTTRTTESAFGHQLRLRRGVGASRWGYFLRAETMHGFYTYLEEHPSENRADPVFHEMSHGESFLEVLASRFDSPGLYVFDEPESALSFSGCLALVALVHDMIATGTKQAIIATHSPIVAAIPGAQIYEVGAAGLTRREWRELELVANWTDFLCDPDVFLRHVLNR